MYRFNSVPTVLVISQTVVLLGTALSNPAGSQGFNFVELNQANQFFNQGKQTFENKIEQFESDIELPEIKLPKNYHRPQKIQNHSSVYQQQNLKTWSSPAIDNQEN